MSVATKDEIVEAISKLTVLELADLVKTLEDKFGVKAMPMAGAHASAGAAGGASAPAAASAQEEKTEFTVTLDSVGPNKIPVIKLVREMTSLGLKEAKDLVEGAPKTLKDGVPKVQAEEMKKKLVEAGAQVTLK